MVILISAVGSTGKTLMAQKLLERYHIPYLSIDHLKMGLYRSDTDCGFTPLDNTEVIGDHLWPIIKGIIMTTIENEQHIIIEGSYLFPHYLKDLDVNYLEKIIAVFFGFSTNYIQENFESKIVKYRNAVELRSSPEDRTIEEKITEHKLFKERCFQSNVTYFEIMNDYANEIMEIYDYIYTGKRRIDGLKK